MAAFFVLCESNPLKSRTEAALKRTAYGTQQPVTGFVHRAETNPKQPD